jgi:hypothetical protein
MTAKLRALGSSTDLKMRDGLGVAACHWSMCPTADPFLGPAPGHGTYALILRYLYARRRLLGVFYEPTRFSST